MVSQFSALGSFLIEDADAHAFRSARYHSLLPCAGKVDCTSISGSSIRGTCELYRVCEEGERTCRTFARLARGVDQETGLIRLERMYACSCKCYHNDTMHHPMISNVVKHKVTSTIVNVNWKNILMKEFMKSNVIFPI